VNFMLTAKPAPVAQPVQVPDDKHLRALFDAWFASDCSFDRSPDATEEDNIAWMESYWYVWQRCRTAMLQPSQFPDGWKLVPVEPTAEMREAYHQAQAEYEDEDGLWSPDHQWKAMLDAAPQEPTK
jgi:hypothetical protein